jgi:hypothetical protein
MEARTQAQPPGELAAICSELATVRAVIAHLDGLVTGRRD